MSNILFIQKDWTIEPLGIGYLSSVLKQQGHRTFIAKSGKENPLDIVDREVIDIIAFSVTTGTHQYYQDMNRYLKRNRPNLRSFFGGPHASFFSEELKKDKYIDVVVRGEAEKMFPNMWKENDFFPSCQTPDLPEKLDDIPFPDRELLYRYEENRSNPIRSVMTSRGCPYSCPYCYNSKYKEMYKGINTVRYRSADNVVQECREIKKDYPNTQMIYFIDDEFIINRKRLGELLEEYFYRVGYLPFHCQIRIEHLTDEIASALKHAGCSGVTFAIETGNEQLRKTLLKRTMTNEQILEGARILHRNGLKFRTENMVGLPTETWENTMETVRLNIACKPTIAWASIFQPYPGLPLGQMCKDMGIWNGRVDSMSASFFDRTIMDIPNARRINNIQKLFSFVVDNPYLVTVADKLADMPENDIYRTMYSWDKTRKYKELYGV